jgi:hypothetical protein
MNNKTIKKKSPVSAKVGLKLNPECFNMQSAKNIIEMYLACINLKNIKTHGKRKSKDFNNKIT